MKFRRLTSALLVMFAGSLFVTTSVASAGPKEDVAAATIQWAQTLGQNDPPLPRAARGKVRRDGKPPFSFLPVVSRDEFCPPCHFLRKNRTALTALISP